MRGSRIFAGLVIIALIAIALIYLEDHGYLTNPKVDNIGQFKTDETAPKPDVPVTTSSADTSTENAPGMPAAKEVPPLGTAGATNAAPENEGYTTAEQAAANIPTKPAASRTQYVDAQGNACRPIQVPVPVQQHVVHHYRRRPMPDNWTYRPTATYSTPCGMIHETAAGQRVVNLQPGMILNIALNQTLSTGEDSVPGQMFTGYLVGPITYCGEVIVPAGAAVQGSLVGSHRHHLAQEDESVLQLRLSALDANGYRVPLAAYSDNRRGPDDVHYKTTGYMDDPNYVETTHTTNHDITLPAQSVVTFYLQGTTPVYF
jgi:hypothetical protein